MCDAQCRHRCSSELLFALCIAQVITTMAALRAQVLYTEGVSALPGAAASRTVVMQDLG